MAEALLEGARRISPLDGRYASGPGVALRPVAPRRRFALRTRADGLEAAGSALGLALPGKPKTSAEGPDGTAALWLGPDEWLVFAGDAAAERLLALDGPAFATEVSDRNVAIRVEGPAAEAVIAEGCPQDLRLRAFPPGAASRTVFGKVEIVLWRRSETAFEIEVWRSFAPYLWQFLEEAARTPAA